MKIIAFTAALLGATVPAAVSWTGDAQSTEVCRMSGATRTTGPHPGLCDHLQRRWTELVGTPAPPGVIRLGNRAGFSGTHDGEWTLNVPPEARSNGRRGAEGTLIAYFANDIVPHEAGHQMFFAFARDLTYGLAANEYGSRAPDWIDEAFAVWMESAQMRTKRGRTAPSRASLLRLVTRTHPGSELLGERMLKPDTRRTSRTVLPPCDKCTWRPDSLRRKYEVTDVGIRKNGVPDTVIWYSDRPPSNADDIESREFYGLAYSLLRFIHARGGAAAVHELMSRYRVDQRPRIEVLSALPGLPASVDAFEKAWHGFVASAPPEGN